MDGLVDVGLGLYYQCSTGSREEYQCAVVDRPLSSDNGQVEIVFGQHDGEPLWQDRPGRSLP